MTQAFGVLVIEREKRGKKAAVHSKSTKKGEKRLKKGIDKG